MHHNKNTIPSSPVATNLLIDRDSQYRLRSMSEHLEALFRCMPAIRSIAITASGSTFSAQVEGVMTPERRTTVLNSVTFAARSTGCLLAVNPSFEPGIAPYEVRNAEIERVLSRSFSANTVWESMRAAFPMNNPAPAEDVLVAHSQQVHLAHAETSPSYAGA